MFKKTERHEIKFFGLKKNCKNMYLSGFFFRFLQGGDFSYFQLQQYP